MKKRFLLLCTCVLATLAFTACGKTAQMSDSIKTFNDEATQVDIEDVDMSEEADLSLEDLEASDVATVDTTLDNGLIPSVAIDGVELHVGDDLALNVDALGECTDYEEAKSCMGEGMDKTFTYGDYVIYTAPQDGSDIIYSILISGNGKISSGVAIGDTKDKIIGIYGESTSENDDTIEYEFNGGDLTLCFTLEDEQIVEIEIYG